MWLTDDKFASAPYHAYEYYRWIHRTIVSRANSSRLKLPLRESTSRLWRKARGDLSVPERIHESLEWIRKVSHAVATATARKGDRGRRGEGSGGGKGVNGDPGTRLRRVRFPPAPRTHDPCTNRNANLLQASSSSSSPYAWHLCRYRNTSCWMRRSICSATSTWTKSNCTRWSGTRTATNFIATRPETSPRC